MKNLALIGIGKWGRHYLSTVNLLPDCQITYLCAKTPEILNTYPDSYIKTTKYNELLTYDDIDGVIIATPNVTHFEIVKTFLQKNIPVLVEKPIVESSSDIMKLLSLQQKHDTPLVIGHTYLFDPAYQEMKKLVKNIGNIRYISYYGTNNGPYREGTSVLWDIGPHAVSLCLDIYQQDIQSVTAWAVNSFHPKTDYFDYVCIKLTFTNNICALITVSWMFPEKKRELVIIGNTDTIIYDAVAEKKLRYYKNMISENNGNQSQKNEMKLSYPTYDMSTPLENELGEFLSVIDKKRPNTYSGIHCGVLVTKVLTAATVSIKKNGEAVYISK